MQDQKRALEVKLRNIENILEKAKAELEHLIDSKDQITNHFREKQNKLSIKKEEARSLSELYESLKAKFELQRSKDIVSLENSIKEQEKDLEVLTKKLKAREMVVRDARNKKGEFDKLCTKEEEMKEQLNSMKLAKKYLTKENYKTFLTIYNSDYPLDGGTEEKIKWLVKFGNYIQLIEQGNI